jgi:large repetitive protein
MTLTVQPIILDTSAALPAGSVNVPYSTTLITFDNSGSNATWSVAPGSQMPGGLSINGAVMSGTPTTAGNYTFSLVATDAGGNVQTNTFTLAVSNLSITNPPTSTGSGQILPIQATVGQFFTFSFGASGGSPLTGSASGLPGGVAIASTTGVLSGTPTNAGTFRVVVTVTSGASTYSRIYGLYVSSGPSLLNLPESATNLQDAVAGQAYTIGIAPTGGTPPYSWTLAAGSSLPAGLALASGVNLPMGFTPGQTIIVGEPVAPGQYSFTLICTDSKGAQMQRIFSLNVSAADILGGGLKTATENVSYNEQLTATGGTPPYTYTYSTIGLNTPLFPTGVTGTAAGLIMGTPTSTGNYNFYATVTDSAHPAHTYKTGYTLTVVNGPNNLEITTPIPFDLTVGKGYGVTESVSGGVPGAVYT